MTLAAHTIVGTVVASLIPAHPIIGLGAAFASHFVLDAIPHWDYSLHSLQSDEEHPLNDDISVKKLFEKDIGKIILDSCIGLIFSTIVCFSLKIPIYPAIFIGAMGGIVPDGLQVVYAKWRHEPMISLQRFHIWIQKASPLKVSPILGITMQIFIVIIIVISLKSFL